MAKMMVGLADDINTFVFVFIQPVCINPPNMFIVHCGGKIAKWT